MFADRFGSYSISATRAGTPNLSRLKSMRRYSRLAPPPRRRDVTRPWWFRPPVLRNGSVSDFSGPSRVISSNALTARNRVPGVTGLNFLMPMSAPLVHVDAFAFRQLDQRLLVRRTPPQPAADAAKLAPIVHRAHVLHAHAEHRLDRLADLDLVRVPRHDEGVRVTAVRELGRTLRHDRPDHDAPRVTHGPPPPRARAPTPR